MTPDVGRPVAAKVSASTIGGPGPAGPLCSPAEPNGPDGDDGRSCQNVLIVRQRGGMRTKQTNTMPRPRMTVRGEFGGDVEELFAHKLAPVARHAHAPVLDVRVCLSRHADPAVALPVEARVNLDVNGRQVRADAVASTARDAADLVVERLVRQLDGRLARRRRRVRIGRRGRGR